MDSGHRVRPAIAGPGAEHERRVNLNVDLPWLVRRQGRRWLVGCNCHMLSRLGSLLIFGGRGRLPRLGGGTHPRRGRWTTAISGEFSPGIYFTGFEYQRLIWLGLVQAGPQQL